MNSFRRYFRLYRAIARNCLIREMAFRGHFLINTFTEMMWFGIMLFFFKVIYMRTDYIAGWTEYQLLLLLGTHYLVIQVFETAFFTNCVDIGDQIRTGSLDFILLKPISPQFLLSVRRVNYSSVANIPFAFLLISYAAYKLELRPTPSQVTVYLFLIGCGALILYSLIFILALSAFWVIRNQNIFELWFPITNFARYPAEMYPRSFQVALIFVVPVLAVANYPAKALLQTLSYQAALYMLAWTIFSLLLGRALFRLALNKYRSASS